MGLVVATDVTVHGGVDVYVAALLEALRRHGHDICVLVEEGSTSAIGANASARGVEVIPLPLYRRWHPREAIELACTAQLAAARPDGIHVVTGSPRSCLALRALAVEFRIPVVITEQQVDQELWLSDEERTEIRASYAAALAVVFVSSGNRDTMARTLGGLDDVRTMVMPNAVDLCSLSAYRKESSRPDVPARLVSAARLSPEKSLRTLVDAVGLLPRTLVRGLDIYGDGPERALLEERITQHGLSDTVVLRGWVDNVTPLLRKHDLFVLPSVAEGMPFALLEAMAIGLPVVCTDVPGNVEALARGAAGVLVGRNDPYALAEGIRQCLEHPDLAEERARTARSLVRRLHDQSTVMDRTAQIWGDATGAALHVGPVRPISARARGSSL